MEAIQDVKQDIGQKPAEVTEYAFAKLNLTLDVLAKREDGYHDMLMLMQTVSVQDSILIRRSGKPGIRASCNFYYVPSDSRNLAVRAAEVYLASLGEPEGQQGIELQIKKEIPVGAGMAGGSADAAAVLRGMNRLFGRPKGRKELETLAAEIGSDVAFCVSGGTALARGRGEILEDLPPMPACSIAICKPGFSISTPELFRKLDQKNVRQHPDTEGMLDALQRQNLREMGLRMYNVFEDLDDRRLRCVTEIKSVFQDHGALGAMMTGTGSAVFGVFADREAAEKSAEELRREYSFCRVAEPVGRLEI